MTVIFIGPFLVALGLLIYKNILFILYGFPISFHSISAHFLMLFAVSIFCIQRKSLLIRSLQSIASFVIIFFNWLDACVMIGITNRLTFDNFIANYKDYEVLPYFLTPKIIIFSLLTWGTYCIFLKRKLVLNLVISSVNFFFYECIFVALICYFFTSKAQGGDNTQFMTVADMQGTHQLEASKIDIIDKQYPTLMQRVHQVLEGAAWKDMTHQKNVSKPNVVIVLSESLSGVDSKYAGGLFDRLPKIEIIQKEGIAIENAVSNGKITIHGLSSLLLGTQPIKTGGYSGIGEQFPPEKFYQNNIIQYAKKLGYKTIVISAGQPRNWQGLYAWFKQVGFDEIYDRESPEFDHAPRFTWNAPSDEAMYQLGDNLISKQKSPYLILIETVSLHPPYILPDQKYKISENYLLNQIHYVDETTYAFYEKLKQSGFFKNGIFLLTGDHRRFEELEKEELQTGGFSRWHERIVSTMVGKNIASHIVSQVPMSLMDMNALLHSILLGQSVDETTLLQANLGSRLDAKTPVSITLADESRGGYLLRSDKDVPLFVSIFGNIPFDQIKSDAYKKATYYLMKNNIWVSQALSQ